MLDSTQLIEKTQRLLVKTEISYCKNSNRTMNGSLVPEIVQVLALLYWWMKAGHCWLTQCPLESPGLTASGGWEGSGRDPLP